MTRSISAALLLGLFAACISHSAVAESAGDAAQVAQLGQTKQFGTLKVTLESFSIHGVTADVVLRMDNLADAERSIAMLLFFEARSDGGELGDYDYAKSNCDGTIPPKGSFKCKLALIFPDAPNQVSLRVGEGMMGETVTFDLAR